MDATTRLKLTLGDMLIQIAQQAERIEELEARLEEQSGEKAKPEQMTKGNSKPPAKEVKGLDG